MIPYAVKEVFNLLPEKDRDILRKELDVLRALNASASGVPVHMEMVLEPLGDIDPEEMLRANSTFIEVAKEKGIDLHV